MSILDKIKGKIEQNQETVYTICDFAEYGNYENVKKSLLRLVNTGYISRIIDGVYYKIKFSKLTNEVIPPSMYEVAKCLARKYHWSILPTKEACLNLLNLSTQIPATYSYISDGPYRKYKINNFILEFKHTTNREIKDLSYKSGIVVQAIRALGKEYINFENINSISNQLSIEEKKQLLDETKEVSSWIRDIILEVCK